MERHIYLQVCDQIAAVGPRLLATAHAMAQVDVFAALAEVAQRNRYVQPVLSEADTIHIIGGRHPVVELSLHDEPFVPNDTLLSPEESILVITGPNMSGKSTYLRQVALIVLLAQIGSFVPAESAEIGLVDRIFTRVGAQDEISAGQSTFMVEMVETANILNHATVRSLLILDEIGRGTSTYDGISIAWATVEYIHNHPRLQSKTLFATHYHELNELADIFPRIKNYKVDVREYGDKVIFLHKVVPGFADHSYGIQVAQMAGLPEEVTDRAKKILKNLEESELNVYSSGRRLKGRIPPPDIQMTLFEMKDDKLRDDIRKLNVEKMTPLEALQKLVELQKRIEEK
jgi:DNA mismatch repair protein MutS